MAQVRGPREFGDQTSTQFLTYEDFQPSSDWTHDLNFHVLLVDLPGFKKEELKVQVDNSWKITVSGERKLSENKYSRFEQVFDIPKDSDIDKINGRFDGGLLFVIIPKKVAEIVEEPKKEDRKAKGIGGEKKQEQEQEQAKNEEGPKKNADDNRPEHGHGVPGKKKEEIERIEKKENLNEGRGEKTEREVPKKTVDTKPEHGHDLPGKRKEETKRIERKEDLKTEREVPKKNVDTKPEHDDDLPGKRKEEMRRIERKEDLKEEKREREGWRKKTEVLKEKAEGLEGFLENAKEIISKNKTAIVTAVFAVSIGLYISHRLRSGGQ